MTASRGPMTAATSEGDMNALQSYSHDIAQWHTKAQQHAESAIECAIKAGELLIEAKAQTKHGEWLPFVETTGMSARTAQGYMRLAKHADEVNTQRVAHLGVKEALKFLAEPKRQSPLELLAATKEALVNYHDFTSRVNFEELTPAQLEAARQEYNALVDLMKATRSSFYSPDFDRLTLAELASIHDDVELESLVAGIKLNAARGIGRISRSLPDT